MIVVQCCFNAECCFDTIGKLVIDSVLRNESLFQAALFMNVSYGAFALKQDSLAAPMLSLRAFVAVQIIAEAGVFPRLKLSAALSQMSYGADVVAPRLCHCIASALNHSALNAGHA